MAILTGQEDFKLLLHDVSLFNPISDDFNFSA